MIEESIGTETLLRLPGDGTTNSSTDRHLEMLKKTRLKVGITDVHERWFLLFSLYLIKILYTFQSICPVWWITWFFLTAWISSWIYANRAGIGAMLHHPHFISTAEWKHGPVSRLPKRPKLLIFGGDYTVHGQGIHHKQIVLQEGRNTWKSAKSITVVTIIAMILVIVVMITTNITTMTMVI